MCIRDRSGALDVKLAEGVVRIGLAAKGCGMISPNMATMLCFVTCDAVVTAEAWGELMHAAVAASFNRITVDGQESTNDMVLGFCNGAPGFTPEAPLQKPSTMSFVDSWPSTVMRLNEAATAACMSSPQASAVTTASQVTKHSIVAMLGLIMPQPLAARPMRTTPSASFTSRSPDLACLSVVRMAAANSPCLLYTSPSPR